LQTKAKLILR